MTAVAEIDLSDYETVEIQAGNLQPGDMFSDGRRLITVETVEVGHNCNGVHINNRYGPATMKVYSPTYKRRIEVPNPLRDAIMFTAGCWHRHSPLTVLRRKTDA